MILIADSGSTKTEWRLISNSESDKKSYFTKGINPFYQTSDDILKSLKDGDILNNLKPEHIHFYGAGCANEEKNNIVKKALTDFFNLKSISINSDLTGAARSLCAHDEGIACILGTGSNSCYYDGIQVQTNVSPLGFILGDEGSGAVIGKKLISDILKNQLPKTVIDLFFDEYKTSANDILNNIYKRPFPNRYLAQYTRFVSSNIDIIELEELVIKSFEEFIKRNLLQYKDINRLKVNFTGSIAFHFNKQLKKALNSFELSLGNLSQSPMNGLIQYHKQQNTDHDKI